MQLRHGQAVQVDYVDLADAEAQTEFAEVLEIIEARSLPYPLVAVNGQLRLAGTAQYYQVLPLVEEFLQPEGAAVDS